MRATGTHRRRIGRRGAAAVVGALTVSALVGVGVVSAQSGDRASGEGVTPERVASGTIDTSRPVASSVVGGHRFTLAPPVSEAAGSAGGRLCLETSLPDGFTSVGCGQRDVILREGALAHYTSGKHDILAGLAPRGATRVSAGGASASIPADRFFVFEVPAGGKRAVFSGTGDSTEVDLSSPEISAG